MKAEAFVLGLWCNSFYFKSLQVKRYYNVLHQHKYEETVGKLREDLVEKLRNSLGEQQSLFKKPIEENKNAIIVSYVVAEKVGSLRIIGRTFDF